VTAIAELYDSQVNRPAERQAQAEKTARQAAAEAAQAAAKAARAAEAPAKADVQERNRVQEAAETVRLRLTTATRAQVWTAEAQLLQAFAAYRVQVDFRGDMARADLVNGFARRVAAGPLPDMVLLYRSESPDVRAILAAMEAFPGFPVHVVPVTFRDGRTFRLPFRNRAEADQVRQRWHREPLPPPAQTSAEAFEAGPGTRDWLERCRVRRAWIEEEVAQAFAELAVEFPRPWDAGPEEAKTREAKLYRALVLALIADPIPDMGLLRESGSGLTRAIVDTAGAVWPPSPLSLPEGQRKLSDNKGLW
jgi:hypothetical protein